MGSPQLSLRFPLPDQSLGLGDLLPGHQPGNFIAIFSRRLDPLDRDWVEVGDYAFFMGLDSVLLTGVTLGRGAVVHPYTEVSRSFPGFANVVGPGKASQRGWRRPARLDPRANK